MSDRVERHGDDPGDESLRRHGEVGVARGPQQQFMPRPVQHEPGSVGLHHGELRQVRERGLGVERLVDHRLQVSDVDFGHALADAAQQGRPGAVVVRRGAFGDSGVAVDLSVG